MLDISPNDSATERLLAAAPDIRDELCPETAALLATFRLDVSYLDRGTWIPPDDLPLRAPIGLLVVEGVIVRRLGLAGRCTAELLGPGDLTRPWEESDFTPPATVTSWEVLDPGRVLELDERICLLGRRCPDLVEVLVARAVRRSRLLNYQHLLTSAPQVERRLVMLFGVLARRWGRVRPDGVLLPVALPHRVLAELVAVRRPSVSHHLGLLADRGIVRRRREGWLLDRSVLEDDPGAMLGPGC